MILGVIQVRMGLTRLKEKVLKLVMGKPMLAVIIDRLRQAKKLDKIVVATTTNEADQAIIRFAKSYGVEVYAGSEMDIIDRLYQTIKRFDAEALVRITGDCPLTDPKIVDEIVELYQQNKGRVDYISNVYPPTYPDGLDTELVTRVTLEHLWNNVTDVFLREWFSGTIIKNPDKFRIINKTYKANLSHLRWTVDYQEDYEFILAVFEKLGKNNELFHMEDVLELIGKEPALKMINNGHVRNEAYLDNKTYSSAVDNL